MKKILFTLFLLIVISSCAAKQPEAKLQCWQSLVSGAFPFVISMVNICDGPMGGTVKFTVVKPVLNFIDKRNKRADKMIEDQIKIKKMEKLF